MKKIFSFLLLMSMLKLGNEQNLGIATNAPNACAQVDITSTSNRFLILKMNASSVVSITSPAKGLLLYDDVLYQLMVNMRTPALTDWQTIAENSGISPANNFIGTTDNGPLEFRVNKVISGWIHNVNRNILIGSRAGFNQSVSSRENTIIGDSAFYSNNQTLFSNVVVCYGVPGTNRYNRN